MPPFFMLTFHKKTNICMYTQPHGYLKDPNYWKAAIIFVIIMIIIVELFKT